MSWLESNYTSSDVCIFYITTTRQSDGSYINSYTLPSGGTWVCRYYETYTSNNAGVGEGTTSTSSSRTGTCAGGTTFTISADGSSSRSRTSFCFRDPIYANLRAL